jgi:hypothetical protein
MITYKITYELSKDNKFICTVSDINLTVSGREEVLPTLKRMYPMFEVDLTTINTI